MKIDKLNISNDFPTTPLKLNKKYVIAGTIIGLSLAATSLLTRLPETVNQESKTVAYYETHKSEYPTLNINVENPEAINTENAKVIIKNQDDLLIEYIKIYPDGYIDIPSTYLFPNDSCTVTVYFNEEGSNFEFNVEDVNEIDNYQLTIDCATRNIELNPKAKQLPHL